MIKILKQCEKEISVFPLNIREYLADVLARLEEGHHLSMPLSRPMSSIGKGVHEIRLKDKTGAYRIIYVLLGKGMIYLLHAFKKKSEKTMHYNVMLAKSRLKEVV
ncbi:type II toxin-antitoxin system RelE/ParE family toxin [bacterium]|nr:type II toxin-antitoxin system RelE/ParE family toxin [bacterium]